MVNLRRHVELVHEKIKRHVCTICKAAFGQVHNLKAHISGTILSMQGITMDINEFEKLKQSIASAPESELEQALDILVQDIFQHYSGNQEELSYDEWRRWFLTLEGVNEVLEQQNNQRSFGGSQKD